MKVNTAAAPVQRFGAEMEEDEFRIKATPKAFQILTSKLYKDKISAVVRELSCNAYDSHVEAGHPERPFSVHLPNLMMPELVIRDFGTGLADRAVRTIFTTFFESTKEDTNDQIGALGLGCKSPFSYTDTYTVKSFFNGRLSTYVCFIENSLPKIKRVSSVATDEPNGVEIRITVNPNDFVTFQSKAKAIFAWFDVHPDISGGRGYIQPSRSVPARSGNGWQFVPASGVSKAIMGNVAYPLDKGVMATHLTDFEVKLLDNFIYHFGIGELDVQAGREELSYDKATIIAIRKRVRRASDDLSLLCKDMFDDCKTMIEATRRFLTKGGGSLFDLVPPRWRGKIITGGVAPPVSGKMLVRAHSRLKTAFPSRRRGGGRKIVEANVIEPWDNITIFVDDLKRGGKTRFMKFSNESSRPCYFFTPEPVDDQVDCNAVVEAFADFGEVRLTSSIPAERSVAKVRMFNSMGVNNLSYLDKSNRREVDIDLEIGGVYVVTKGGEVMSPDGSDTISLRDLQAFLKVFWALSPNTTVYVVPFTMRKKFEVEDGWATMFEDVFERLETKLKEPAFIAEAHAMRDKDDFSITLFERSEQIAALLPKTHPFHKFINRYNEVQSVDTRFWYPFMRMVDGTSMFWPQGRKARPLFDRKKFKLRELWKSLDDLPLLKAVASNAPLQGEALRDLATYAQHKILDTAGSES